MIGLWNRGRNSLLASDNTMMSIFFSVQHKQDCKVFFTTTRGKIHVEGTEEISKASVVLRNKLNCGTVTSENFSSSWQRMKYSAAVHVVRQTRCVSHATFCFHASGCAIPESHETNLQCRGIICICVNKQWRQRDRLAWLWHNFCVKLPCVSKGSMGMITEPNCPRRNLVVFSTSVWGWLVTKKCFERFI